MGFEMSLEARRNGRKSEKNRLVKLRICANLPLLDTVPEIPYSAFRSTKKYFLSEGILFSGTMFAGLEKILRRGGKCGNYL